LQINAIQITPLSSSGQPINPPAGPNPNATPSLPIRINAGGKAYTDKSGNKWSADAFYNSVGLDERLWNPVATIYGTADDSLYMTAKYDPSASQPALKYDIPVPNGEMEVTLHFCELYAKAMYKGARLFDAIVEGKKVLSRLDIYAEGGGFTALKKTVDAKVQDGKLSISFGHIKENPKVRKQRCRARDKPWSLSNTPLTLF
jgi:hypothetical protein